MKKSRQINNIGNVETGTNPLHIAAFLNRTDIVRELLKVKGLNIAQRSTDGQTALFLAAEQNNVEIVEILLKEGEWKHMNTIEKSSKIHFFSKKNFKTFSKNFLKNFPKNF